MAEMSFADYVIAAERHRKLCDMSDLLMFNMYDNYENFQHDVHTIYDGRYDNVMKLYGDFYRYAIDGPYREQ